MVTDRIRADGLHNTIINTTELFMGKVVLSVLISIFSMPAAQAGSAKTIGIDWSLFKLLRFA